MPSETWHKRTRNKKYMEHFTWRALLMLTRPTQWVKNIFVLAGVFFAESWRRPGMLESAGTAFIAFCLASSAVYCVNDVMDAEVDKFHPRKRYRPVASGKVSSRTAYALAGILFVSAFSINFFSGLGLSAYLAGYALVNLLYSRFLKHMVLLDVFCIAFGFVVRLLAGTRGLGIEPSVWILLCTLNLSLFLGFSKRYAELNDDLRTLEEKRVVLQKYSLEFLRILLAASMSATLISYGLYTTSERTVEIHGSTHLFYTLPIAMFGLFRYLYLVMEKGQGENTLSDFRKDPSMIIICGIYIVVCLFVLGN